MSFIYFFVVVFLRTTQIESKVFFLIAHYLKQIYNGEIVQTKLINPDRITTIRGLSDRDEERWLIHCNGFYFGEFGHANLAVQHGSRVAPPNFI